MLTSAGAMFKTIRQRAYSALVQTPKAAFGRLQTIQECEGQVEQQV
jgi:hypothetical protein